MSNLVGLYQEIVIGIGLAVSLPISGIFSRIYNGSGRTMRSSFKSFSDSFSCTDFFILLSMSTHN